MGVSIPQRSDLNSIVAIIITTNDGVSIPQRSDLNAMRSERLVSVLWVSIPQRSDLNPFVQAETSLPRAGFNPATV